MEQNKKSVAFAAQQSDVHNKLLARIGRYNKGQKLSTGLQVTVTGIQPC
jgi:hypothetical protein